MDPDELLPSLTLRRLVNGYRVSQAIHVAVTMGIADLLTDGPRPIADLAAAVGAHPPTLYRLLRALSSVGVLHEGADRRFSLTPVGDCLRSDASDSARSWAAYVGQPYVWQSWAYLEHSVRTGKAAFPHIHGTDVWDYRKDHPELGTVFDRAMTEMSRSAVVAALDAFDFGRFTTMVDVGGGHGALLAAILARYPSLLGILFDVPHVVAGAERVLSDAAVVDRCRVASGDFFDAVPDGGDAYLLKSILHDWDDEQASAILRTVLRAMPGDGTLLVVERVLSPPNEGLDTKLSDLNMLVQLGGRERDRDEWEALLVASGFRLTGVTPTASPWSVIEGVPA